MSLKKEYQKCTIGSIEIDLYKYTITVLIGTSVHKVLKAVGKYGPKGARKDVQDIYNEDIKYDGEPDGLYSSINDLRLIVIPENVKQNSLTHEVFHATCHLMQLKGVTLTDESEEAFAYLNGYLNSEVLKILNRHNKGTK